MTLGWDTKMIGEVCHLMTGGTPSRAKPEYFGGDIKWLVSGDIHKGEILDCEGRITETGMKNSNAKLLPIDSVMIALNGQGKTRGTVALLRTEATCNQSLVSIYPKDPKKLLPEFLYMNLHSRYQEIRHMTGDSGNDRRGLNMGLVGAIRIPIPPPTGQQRIVTIFDRAFAAIATAKANTEKNLQNARAIFESSLEKALSHRNSDWTETTLGNEVNLLAGFAFKSSGYTKGNGSVKLLRGDNIVQGTLRWDDARFWPAREMEQYERYQLAEGDIVLAMDRPWVSAGLKRAMISREDLPCLLVQRVARLRTNNALENLYLLYLIESQSFTSHILGSQTGIGVPHISGYQIQSFRFCRPPIQIQRRISGRLNELKQDLKRLSAIYQQQLSRTEDLRHSLLHQAFSGAL